MSAQQETKNQQTSLQLGLQKYLYTGYFVAGCIMAYLGHQVAIKFLGEDNDAIATLIAVVVGIAGVAIAWRNTRLRTLSQETIRELSEVTWPTREETYTNTTIVIVASLVSALVIFFLDRVFLWMTDKLLSGHFWG